ncbi:MAG: glutamate--cysteine ligase [Nocardioidaceae bacterium]|nr:glutamate--cysteine ligase [Nocardioidaceae bacterium]MDQ3165407.1 glutamate--cysteine ligase [Actinomycetota bacterium]
MSTRRVGVEEELLLVDPGSGALKAVSDRALRGAPDADDVAVEQELFLQQIETGTTARDTLSDLEDDLRAGRRAAGEAAATAGAAVVAVAAPVLASQRPDVTPKDRYHAMMDRFGAVARAQIVCGMHVHVDVADDDEAIGAFDRMRPWLPMLLALSANSPFWQGEDTGYASWRSQVWQRWPTAGPTEPFGDAEGYRRVAQELEATGAAMDTGMLYFDARPSRRYPTLELRSADVCTEVDDTVLIAALSRGLVTTAAQAWSRGDPVPAVRTDLLRAATWRASRYGIADMLVHPVSGELAPARLVVEGLLGHVWPALTAAGDATRVTELVERLFARGSGAARQRAVREAHSGDLGAVVADLRRRTEASWRDR